MFNNHLSFSVETVNSHCYLLCIVYKLIHTKLPIDKARIICSKLNLFNCI